MSFQLPESIVDSLLDKLGHDDAFRDRFAADARAALASLGFGPAADAGIEAGVWACIQVSHLASKESIRASHDSLKAQLCAQRAAYNPISIGIRTVDDKRAA